MINEDEQGIRIENLTLESASERNVRNSILELIVEATKEVVNEYKNYKKMHLQVL
ncbi:MAG: hypothetical protein ACOVO1_09370 [Chitinophagaceae bacterium]